MDTPVVRFARGYVGVSPATCFGALKYSNSVHADSIMREHASSLICALICVALKLDSAVHGNVRSFDPIGIAL